MVTKLLKRQRVTKPSEERFEDLMTSALTVFSKRGISMATIDEITDRAQVAKGTFYLYFKSKDYVVQALWKRHLDDFTSIVDNIANDQTLEPAQQVIKAFVELTRNVLENADLHRLVYGTAAAEALELCRLDDQKVIKTITSIVRGGIKAKQLSCKNPDLVVSMLFHGICRSLHDVMMSKKPINKKMMLQTSEDIARSTFDIKN
ncbi:MAG: hypothetical protein COB49_07445 [Alphaproteobacteria bacterium]|nr:MAG: hypothetical protein COB49_07445 [Alphaproteobacteria bacterium]